ncbi:response regulator [Actinoplanes sp. NPDC049265]|uniref:response regulator n=1 Tax=Actinoplanes sp. NPDC049265 TaxID=3363902 RepID=UPI00371712AE
MISVIVADDQRVVRDGLTVILSAMDDIRVAGVAWDGAEAVVQAERHDADVVLMDLRMPGVDGIEATRRLRASRPGTAVVALTTYSDDESVLAALRAGATGYLTKNASAEDIHRALHAAVAGQTLLDAEAAARLVAARSGGPGEVTGGLSPRERDVLRLIARGLSNAEIAAHLFISGATVKTHINQIFAKTQSRDRAQAILYAHRHGL